MTGWIIQRGGIGPRAVAQFHSLDPVIRPWTMNRDTALRGVARCRLVYLTCTR